MSDIYATINQASPETLAAAAQAMEVSASDPQHHAIVASYVADLAVRSEDRVLEIGCGTGAIARLIAGLAPARTLVGIDPSPYLVSKARELACGLDQLTFLTGDGTSLPWADPSFDVVVLHRMLSHVTDPARVLAEAFRVLQPGGRIAVCDGDYATITLATGDCDPLQVCVDAFAPAYITDRWLVRKLRKLVLQARFVDARFRSYGFAQLTAPTYMLGIAERGADVLAGSGRIGPQLAEALKEEARRRVAAGEFFGQISYASVIARKPVA